jgi:hypothetical protein
MTHHGMLIGVLWVHHTSVYEYWERGGLLHVDMFAHNKSGIVYRDGEYQ